MYLLNPTQLTRGSARRGLTTRMKTVEITRAKSVAPSLIPGQPPAHVPSAMETFRTLYQTEGLRGINKGVNAVALRQATNCASASLLSLARTACCTTPS